MNIIILGAGAIGLVFGGFLAKAGHRVVLLGRERTIQAVRQHGLLIDGLWGNHCITDIKAYTTLEEVKTLGDGQFDLALLTVKSYDTESMLKMFQEFFPEPIPILSLQNGIGNLEKVIQIIGRSWAIGGRVIFGAELAQPGNVKVTVYAEEVMIGGVKDGFDYQKAAEIATLLSDAGIPTLATREIEAFLWGKALYNSALNGLGTILGVNYGLLRESESSRKLITSIVQEFFQVLEKENRKLAWPDADAYLEDLFDRLIPATSDHYPSMLRDIQQQKRTEIDALNGAIVQIAQGHGIEVPVNWLITNLVKVKEKMALKKSGRDARDDV